MATLRDHLTPLLAEYRAQISRGRFEEVERALRASAWLETDESVPHLEPDELHRLKRMFGELQGAVSRRDQDAAVRTIARVRRWVHRIPVY